MQTHITLSIDLPIRLPLLPYGSKARQCIGGEPSLQTIPNIVGRLRLVGSP